MPKQTIGYLIKTARVKKGLDREQAAKKIKISPAYLGHLERDGLVFLSERVMNNAHHFLGVPKRKISALAQVHNKKASAWRKAYLAKRSTKSAA